MSTNKKKVFFEYRKLKGRIIEIYGSQQAFANAIGATRATVNNYLMGKSSFTQLKIIEWAEILHIDYKDYLEYFFA